VEARSVGEDGGLVCIGVGFWHGDGVGFGGEVEAEISFEEAGELEVAPTNVSELAGAGGKVAYSITSCLRKRDGSFPIPPLSAIICWRPLMCAHRVA
jgi:hypothetical protein